MEKQGGWHKETYVVYSIYQFQIKGEIKSAKIEKSKEYKLYVEKPKTNQGR